MIFSCKFCSKTLSYKDVYNEDYDYVRCNSFNCNQYNVKYYINISSSSIQSLSFQYLYLNILYVISYQSSTNNIFIYNNKDKLSHSPLNIKLSSPFELMLTPDNIDKKLPQILLFA